MTKPKYKPNDYAPARQTKLEHDSAAAEIIHDRDEGTRTRELVTAEDVRNLVVALGGRPIAFIPTYAKLPGCNANCAILLSQMIYWTSKIPPEKNGWFYKTRKDWSEETALSLQELDVARKKLRECGVVSERLNGVPARRFYRVNCAPLANLLKTGFRETSKLDSGKDSAKVSGNNQARLGKTSKLYKEQETTQQSTRQENTDKREAPPSRTSVLVPLSDDFTPSDDNYKLADALGIEHDELQSSFDKFFDYYQSKGTKMADWHAAFNLWMQRGRREGWDL
jgi:hypothetical protein